MIVSEDNPGATVLGCVGHDVADRQGYGIGLAFILFDVQAACLFVDMRDPQPLAVASLSREAPGEEASRGILTV